MNTKAPNNAFPFSRELCSLVAVIQALGPIPAYALGQAGTPQNARSAALPPIQTNINSQATFAVSRLPAPEAKPSLLPKFSADPKDEEIMWTPVLAETLVPTGRTSSTENKALAKCLLDYVTRSQSEDQSYLLKFLSDFPNSAWKPALLVNLGLGWRAQGYFSRAINAWEEAWRLSKGTMEPKAKALADRAFGELVQINAWVGRYEKLEPLLAELGDRHLIGGASEMLFGARQGLYAMKTTPEKGFMCGPYAVQELLQATRTNADFAKVFAAKSTRQGFSLTQVRDLARDSGLDYQMAKRTRGSSIPVNSIIHWKLNHYGAVLKEDNGRFLIQDSTFSRFFGQELWMSKAAIEEESDGYFLIPAGPLPDGWQGVQDNEGSKVWGKGPTTGPDPKAFSRKDAKLPCEPAHGMAQYSAHLMLLSLNIVDIPVGYTPPRGPSVDFVATYNQRDGYVRPFPATSSLGSKWNCEWFSYISDQGSTGARTTVYRYPRGGGQMIHSGYDLTSGLYSADLDGGVLKYIPASDTYELTLPDGSTEVFGQPSRTDGGPRNMFLTALKDPAGNTVTIVYEGQVNSTSPYKLRLHHINDALGQSTIFYYDLADPYKITRVEDPFHRFAHLDYDENGYLRKITDVIGITSVFSYASGSDIINQMTTPYGATTFSFTENSGANTRSLLITDPNGDREYLLFNENTPYPASTETEYPNIGVGNANLQYRNTFYFDKKAMQQFVSPPLPQLTTNDLPKATIYHWLHGDPVTSSSWQTSGLIESIKPPLESRIFFLYQDQQNPIFGADVKLRQPRAVSRMVDDPNNPNNAVAQTYLFEYNTKGNPTKFTDPRDRETSLDYYANGIDLQRIRQTMGGSINDVLAEFGTYDTHHCPASYTDAARQTFGLTWNTSGQLTQIDNPKSETTFLAYDANGYLLSVLKYIHGGPTGSEWTYDSYGRVRTVKRLAGFSLESHKLTYDYDALDRMTRITYPDQTFNKYDYSRLDLIRIWDRTGHRTQITYDALGRPLTVKDRLGRLTQISWCGCGGLASITDPMNHVTSWVRDLEGRVYEKDYHDTRKVQYSYDSRSSRLKSITDAKNQVKNYTYFEDDTLKGISYSSAGTTNVTFTYGPNYRRVATISDGTGTTAFDYKPITSSGTLGAGRLASVDGPLSNDTITYDYDELGRVLSSAVNNVAETVTYDELGRLVTHTTPLGTVTVGYWTIIPSPGPQAPAIAYTFLPMQLALPGDRYITYDYTRRASPEDPNNPDQLSDLRLTRISNPTSTFEYSHDVLGRITHWKQGDRPYDYQPNYDAEGQLLDVAVHDVLVETESGQPTESSAYHYSYDSAGNRTSEQVDPRGWSRGGPVTVVTKSIPNTVNQVTLTTDTGSLPIRVRGTVSETATVTVNGQAAQVAPDPAGPAGGKTFGATINLEPGSRTAEIQATDFGANAGNVTTTNYEFDVVGGGARTFTYDDNGNLTIEAVGAHRVGVYDLELQAYHFTPAHTNQYEWDAEDRLVKITRLLTNSPTLITEFSYDGLGRRVKIIEKSDGSVTSTKQFVWTGRQIAEERDGNNNVTKRFYAEGQINYQPSTINLFYSRDHLGSVREMYDSSGTVRASYDYDPYGRRTKTAGDLDADFGFTGHYFHAPSGLHLALYRAYDADIGRWLNRDPIGETGGPNLYGYVYNNPLGWTDPSGFSGEGEEPDAEMTEPLPRRYGPGEMPEEEREREVRDLLSHPAPSGMTIGPASPPQMTQEEFEQQLLEQLELPLLYPRTGRPTSGIFCHQGNQVPLRSGWQGPAARIPRGTPGFDIVTRTHVEGHSAALMRLEGIASATAYINNPAICSSCVQNLPTMLPPGATLNVVLPNGTSATFVGNR